jgi:hypothetical protein
MLKSIKNAIAKSRMCHPSSSRPATNRGVRLHVEPLEGRAVPANLTITYAASSHTLTIVGDNDANVLDIQGDVNDPTRFTVTSTGTINNGPGTFATPNGVQNMTIRLSDGNDILMFVEAPTIQGRLTIDGGDGDNSVSTIGSTLTGLTVGKDFSITNGAGYDSTVLTDLFVGGSLIVRNGDGGSDLKVQRDSVGVSTIGGSVRVKNGSGPDSTSLNDLNVGGGVTVENGHTDANGFPGTIQIANYWNTAFRSQIRGSVSVSYLDGVEKGTSDVLADVVVGGNVTFAYGAASCTTVLDGNVTGLPTIVNGSLSITSTVAHAVELGIGLMNKGLVVGRSLSITGGAGFGFVNMNKLQVDGSATLRLGDGSNTVNINDSSFGGSFRLTTGALADVVNLDTITGGPAATTFRGPVLINLGAGNDTVNVAGLATINQAVEILGTFVVHHGTGSDVLNVNPSHEFFPFGTSIQWVV